MNFKNPFNRLFNKTNHTSATPESPGVAESAPSDWDSLAAINPDAQSGISFDDLANEVPFAGTTSVTEESVTLVLPALLKSQ